MKVVMTFKEAFQNKEYEFMLSNKYSYCKNTQYMRAKYGLAVKALGYEIRRL